MERTCPDKTPAPDRVGWRTALGNVIYDNDTRAGRLFDAALTLCILASITLIMLDSVRPIHAAHGALLRRLEGVFTLLFSLEYGLRLITAHHPLHSLRSPFGVVDALSILPGYFTLLPGAQYLLVIRMVRLLRVFRILHLGGFLSEARVLGAALRASVAKITVFLLAVLVVVVLVGTAMFALEGPARGFTSIPASVSWAIVTLTTVGYGDISSQTPLGKALASLVMVLGYGIIAVPTGLITAGLTQRSAGAVASPPARAAACPTTARTPATAAAAARR